MYANALVEHLNDWGMRFKNSSVDFCDYAKKISSSVKFYFGEVSPSLEGYLSKKEKNRELIFQDDIKLPYARSLFMFDKKFNMQSHGVNLTISKVCCYLDLLDSGRMKFLDFYYSDDFHSWIPGFFEFEFRPKEKESLARPVQMYDGENVFCEDTKITLVMASHCVGFLFLLDCKNIVQETIIPPEKLNKSRIKKGKIPLFEYKILNVELPGHKKGPYLGTGKGSPQRVHLCRGHFKEYTTEKPLFGRYTGRYWWQPTVRGKGDGIIEKEYRVKVAS